MLIADAASIRCARQILTAVPSRMAPMTNATTNCSSRVSLNITHSHRYNINQLSRHDNHFLHFLATDMFAHPGVL